MPMTAEEAVQRALPPPLRRPGTSPVAKRSDSAASLSLLTSPLGANNGVNAARAAKLLGGAATATNPKAEYEGAARRYAAFQQNKKAPANHFVLDGIKTARVGGATRIGQQGTRRGGGGGGISSGAAAHATHATQHQYLDAYRAKPSANWTPSPVAPRPTSPGAVVEWSPSKRNVPARVGSAPHHHPSVNLAWARAAANKDEASTATDGGSSSSGSGSADRSGDDASGPGGSSLNEPTNRSIGMLAAAMAARARLRAAKNAMILDRFDRPSSAMGPALQRALGADSHVSALMAGISRTPPPPPSTSVVKPHAAQQLLEKRGVAVAASSAEDRRKNACSGEACNSSSSSGGADGASSKSAYADYVEAKAVPPLVGVGGGEAAATTTTTVAASAAKPPATAKEPRAASAAAHKSDAAAVAAAPSPAALAMANREHQKEMGKPSLGKAGRQVSKAKEAISQMSRSSSVGLGLGGVGQPAAADGSASMAPAPSSRASRGQHASDPLLVYGYVTQSPIAAGAFSQVVRARHTSSGREVAVKTFATKQKGGKAPADIDQIKAEIEALKVLMASGHLHIANLLETYENEFELHAMLEYCGGGSVSRHIQSRGPGVGLDEREAALLTAQVGSGLAHMHGLGITHRDVKPDNVIFIDRTRANVRLVDFGFAAISRGQRLKTMCGSPAYMAPELISGKAYLGPPVDVWALGNFLFELLHGKVAFRGASMAELNMRIRKANHQAFRQDLGGKSKGAIKRFLTVDVEQRPSAAEQTRQLVKDFSLKVPAIDKFSM